MISLGQSYVTALNAALEPTMSSPPQSFTEPLTKQEIGTYLNLPASMVSDADKGGELTAMIVAARVEAEKHQNRDLVVKQWDLTLDFWPNEVIELRTPLISVDLVRGRDSDGNLTTFTEGVDYIVDVTKKPGIIAPPYNLNWPVFTPWPTSAVLIRFSSGVVPGSEFWSDIGAVVKQGMKLLISDWWNKRLPFGVGSAVFEFPFAVTSCLSYGAVPRVR